ncbi:MAG: thioesterase II family protein [Pikeienuella sp.]
MNAPLRLICLPPAGAGPSLFQPWRRADPHVEAPAIPGREARFREKEADSLEMLADGLAADIAARPPRRYALFGYSMGGTVAFLLAERLAARGLPGPEAFFVLGAPAPHLLGVGVDGLHRLETGDFWREIAGLGGTPDEILNDPEMRALFEPALRADFRLCGAHRPRATGFRLGCPVHVFVADEDHLVDGDCAAAWRPYVAEPARLHRIAGGHMLGPAAFAALLGAIRALTGNAQAGAAVGPVAGL